MTQIIVWGTNDIVVGCLGEVEYQVAKGDDVEDQDIKNVDARNDEGLPNHKDSNAVNSQDSKKFITYLTLINDGAMGYAILVAHIFRYIYAKL